jgi:3-oxoacyl-[acyl-carrier protein] reductase
VTRPLAAKVALVTGASRGIGRSVALALAGSGADLVVCSTRLDGTQGLLQELAALGVKAVAAAGDLTLATTADALVQAAIDAFGRVDILVNNAGVVQRLPLVELTDEDFERVLGVNLSAPFRLTRRLLPGMLARRYGRIVNVSSISGTLGTPRLSSYCASKWGLNGLTRSLAKELDGTGVMVAAVLPGSVDTDMLKGSGFTPDMTAEDVARLVRFLCEDAPMAMNGSLVEIFG